MNDLEMKNLWKAQLVPPPAASNEAMILAVRKKMKKFDSSIFWRDMREFGASLFVLYWFGYRLLPHEKALPALALAGQAIIVLSCLFIDAKLLYARRKRRPQTGIFSVRESLVAECEKVDRQIRMLNSVLWWYILPILLGCVLFFCGMNPDPAGRIGYTVGCMVLGAVLWWVNRYAARHSLEPIKTELQKTIESTPEFSASGSNPQENES